MPRVNQRNVEIIRKKNLEDNQIFLEQLLLTSIRKDFISSARSILPERKVTYRTYEKVERVTRYNENVKSGKILPHVPQWQRDLEEKKKAIELKRLEREKYRLETEKRKEERRLLMIKRNEERKQRLLETEKRREERRLELERRKQRLIEIEKRREEHRLELERRKQRQLELENRREERRLESEKRRLEREAKQRERHRSVWSIYQRENPCPYKRVFIPRQTNVGRRAEENSF